MWFFAARRVQCEEGYQIAFIGRRFGGKCRRDSRARRRAGICDELPIQVVDGIRRRQQLPMVEGQ
jgi:hypothetical protein